MSETGPVALVVLAAGGSARLGSPKQLLELNGKPVLEHVLDRTRDAPVDLRYIVIGHAAREIRHSVDLSGHQVIVNPDYDQGQSTSIRIALRQFPESVSAAIFVLGDQPTQNVTVIEQIVASFRGDHAPIIQPQYVDGPGNPVLIASDLFNELEALTGDTGARPILRDRASQIRYINVAPLRRPVDVDTVEDYRRLIESQPCNNVENNR